MFGLEDIEECASETWLVFCLESAGQLHFHEFLIDCLQQTNLKSSSACLLISAFGSRVDCMRLRRTPTSMLGRRPKEPELTCKYRFQYEFQVRIACLNGKVRALIVWGGL